MQDFQSPSSCYAPLCCHLSFKHACLSCSSCKKKNNPSASLLPPSLRLQNHPKNQCKTQTVSCSEWECLPVHKNNCLEKSLEWAEHHLSTAYSSSSREPLPWGGKDVVRISPLAVRVLLPLRPWGRERGWDGTCLRNQRLLQQAWLYPHPESTVMVSAWDMLAMAGEATSSEVCSAPPRDASFTMLFQLLPYSFHYGSVNFVLELLKP